MKYVAFFLGAIAMCFDTVPPPLRLAGVGLIVAAIVAEALSDRA